MLLLFLPGCEPEEPQTIVVRPPSSGYHNPDSGEANKEIWRTVIRVVDGDTVVLDGNEKVSLIGVDTPEKHQSAKLDADAKRTRRDKKTIIFLGTIASDFTFLLCNGKKVRLEYDQTRKDKYGRTLAYLYLEDGTFINKEIVQKGWGSAYTKYPFRYMEEFRKAEREARENERGLWAEEYELNDKFRHVVPVVEGPNDKNPTPAIIRAKKKTESAKPSTMPSKL
jgi:micrococcal nuclease